MYSTLATCLETGRYKFKDQRKSSLKVTVSEKRGTPALTCYGVNSAERRVHGSLRFVVGSITTCPS